MGDRMNTTNKTLITIAIVSMAITMAFGAGALAQTSQATTPENCFGTKIQGITMSQQCIIFSDNAWDDLMIGKQGEKYLKNAMLFHEKQFKIFCGTPEQTQAAKNARAICHYEVKQ